MALFAPSHIASFQNAPLLILQPSPFALICRLKNKPLSNYVFYHRMQPVEIPAVWLSNDVFHQKKQPVEKPAIFLNQLRFLSEIAATGNTSDLLKAIMFSTRKCSRWKYQQSP